MKRVIISLLFLLVSCSFLNDDSKKEVTKENLVFQTDKNIYNAKVREDLPPVFYDFTLIARFENRTDRTLYLHRCDVDSPHPIFGLKLARSEESKTSAYTTFLACAGHKNPITVKSGSARIDTLNIRSPQAWDHETKEPIGVFEGTFQLFYDVWTCKSGDGCDLPDSLSSSNEFEVRLAE